MTAVENTHFCFHENDRHKSYSYRFETADRVIVVTGDTGPNDAVTELARDADLLLAEANSVEDRKRDLIDRGAWEAMTPDERARIMRQAKEGHLTPDGLGKMAARANVKSVVLTHLTQRVGSDDYTPWAEEVRNTFPATCWLRRT